MPEPDRIGIDFISAFGMPPVQFVGLAADLGCRHIGMGLVPIPPNPHHYAAWSLRDDARLRRETIAAMRDRGVAISLNGGGTFLVRPGKDVRDQLRDLELLAELGVGRINISSIERDQSRALEQLGVFAEMIHNAGMEATLEFAPGMAISTLSEAVAALRLVGRREFRLLIDAMHFVRSGSTAADIAALDPELIGYAQLCDVPLVSRFDSYMDEARFERMVPGTGELPLVEIVAVLPRHIVLGLEVPMLSQAQAGMGPHQRLAPCVSAARKLLAQVEGNG